MGDSRAVASLLYSGDSFILAKLLALAKSGTVASLATIAKSSEMAPFTFNETTRYMAAIRFHAKSAKVSASSCLGCLVVLAFAPHLCKISLLGYARFSCGIMEPGFVLRR